MGRIHTRNHGVASERSGAHELPVGSRYKPIAGYGVIGNTRTVALVGYDGSIDWCCLPRFDSPSVFAAILDSSSGGQWALTPREKATAIQSYVSQTNVLQTEFAVDGSRVIVTDFMPYLPGDGYWSAPPEIHREVECVKGTLQMRTTVHPALEYGSVTPRMKENSEGISIRSARHEMVVSSSLHLSVENGRASKEFWMKQGDREAFVLSYGECEPRSVDEYQTDLKRRKTEAYWKGWVSGLTYDGIFRDEVIRSALVLKMLIFSPTGAIVAAPTTSLPEAIGGERNWDYRYSWLRDSANSLWAFHLLGDKSDSERYVHWLVSNNPVLDMGLKLMYTIDGGRNIPEKTLDHLEGYRRSAPVRVGNGAENQLQHDAYGYILDALYFSSKHGASVNEEMYYRFVKPLAGRICDIWRKPGNGIWEIRGSRAHYVYSKVWCYAGLDRACKIARASGHPEDVEKWGEVMQEIKAEVFSKGWNARKKSFVMHYGTSELDSANLMMPLVGFLPATDERVIATVDAIKKELGEGVLLKRYRVDDGLKGNEGAFLLCSFWMVACLAKMQRVGEAKRMLTELLGFANSLGLYSEEVDVRTGEALGNFPQAFSHMGFIMAAHEINRALTIAKNTGG